MAISVATSHVTVFGLLFVDICDSICLPTSHYMIHKKDETSFLTVSKGLEWGVFNPEATLVGEEILGPDIIQKLY